MMLSTRKRRAALIGVVSGATAWAGLHRQPPPFPPPGGGFPPGQFDPTTRWCDLPALPEPVRRWLRALYGAQVPLIETVAVTGRGRVRPFGVWLPARFRFTHRAGWDYSHQIQVCWAGVAVLTIHESFVGGVSRFELPGGKVSSGPQVSQAANLGMWAELAAAAPAVLATDPRLRWEEIDSRTARLRVPPPVGAAGQALLAPELICHFAPDTGELVSMDARRFRSADDDTLREWSALNGPGRSLGPPGPGGLALPSVGTARWQDQAGPWARFVTEDLRYNLPVEFGPQER